MFLLLIVLFYEWEWILEWLLECECLCECLYECLCERDLERDLEPVIDCDWVTLDSILVYSGPSITSSESFISVWFLILQWLVSFFSNNKGWTNGRGKCILRLRFELLLDLLIVLLWELLILDWNID